MRDNLIKRSDAIAIIEKRKAKIVCNSESDKWFRKMISEVEAIPSADRPRGEWIDDDFVGQYRCSECDYYAIDEYDYCPNCGADMRKESE